MTKFQKSYRDYDHPDDILNDVSLSKDMKIEFLKCWAVDEEALSRANSDGMGIPTRPSKLRYVRKALAKLTPDVSQ